MGGCVVIGFFLTLSIFDLVIMFFFSVEDVKKISETRVVGKFAGFF